MLWRRRKLSIIFIVNDLHFNWNDSIKSFSFRSRHDANRFLFCLTVRTSKSIFFFLVFCYFYLNRKHFQLKWKEYRKKKKIRINNVDMYLSLSFFTWYQRDRLEYITYANEGMIKKKNKKIFCMFNLIYRFMLYLCRLFTLYLWSINWIKSHLILNEIGYWSSLSLFENKNANDMVQYLLNNDHTHRWWNLPPTIFTHKKKRKNKTWLGIVDVISIENDIKIVQNEKMNKKTEEKKIHFHFPPRRLASEKKKKVYSSVKGD